MTNQELIDKARSGEIVFNGRSQITALVERLEVYEKALGNIVKHLDTVGGYFATFSTTRHIAQAALDTDRGKDEPENTIRR